MFESGISLVPETVQAWKSELQSKGRSKIAETVASPETHPELFEEGWAGAIKRESAAAPTGA